MLSTPRKVGAGGGKSRVIEVVHVRRSGPRPAEDRPSPAPWSVRAEVWPEGLRAKPAPPLPPQDIQPVAPEPARPIRRRTRLGHRVRRNIHAEPDQRGD